MKTISKNLINEIIIKNSRFICCLIKLNNNSNINEILESIKQDYPKATHYCYGYIKNNKVDFNAINPSDENSLYMASYTLFDYILPGIPKKYRKVIYN